MNKGRLLMGTLMFGSIWGMLECTLGAFLHLVHLPAGAVMTSIAVGLMILSRRIYKQRGMQLGMGFIAGSFKLLNLGFIGGCVWCAMVAIIVEALAFEAMLYVPHLRRFYEIDKLVNKVATGAFMGYGCYVLGFMLTEFITPLFFTAGFYLGDLISLIPTILLKGLIAAVLTGILVPVVLTVSNFDASRLNAKMYYPATSGIVVMCWLIAVIV